MATVREGVMKKAILAADYKGEVIHHDVKKYVADTDYVVKVIERHVEKAKNNLKGSPIIIAGGSVSYTHLGYETYGLFQSEQEIAGAANQDKVSGGIKLMPGDIRFVDRNNDGVIDWGDNTVDNPGDKKIIGNSTPRDVYKRQSICFRSDTDQL